MEGEDHIGYIYLLQTRGDVCQGNDIYKIGSAKIYEKRINHYDNYATIYAVYKVNHYKGVEQMLIFLFKTHFTKEIECGKEYFHGNVFEMMGLIEKFFMSFKVYFIEKVSLFSEFKNDRILHHIIYNDENTNKKFYHYIENIKRIHGIEVNKANFREYMKFFEKYIYRQKYNIDYENYMEPKPESEEEKLKNEVMNHESEKYEIESNHSDHDEEEDIRQMNDEVFLNTELPIIVSESTILNDQVKIKKVIKRRKTKRNKIDYSRLIIEKPITCYICHHCCDYFTSSKTDMSRHINRNKGCKKVIDKSSELLYKYSLVQRYKFSIDIKKLETNDLIFIINKYSDPLNHVNQYFRNEQPHSLTKGQQEVAGSRQPNIKEQEDSDKTELSIKRTNINSEHTESEESLLMNKFYNSTKNKFICNICNSEFIYKQGIIKHFENDKLCIKRKNIIDLLKSKLS